MNQISCLEVLSRLDDFLDGNLSPGEVALIVGHFDDCFECASEYRFEAMVLAGLKARLRRIEAPPTLLSSIILLLQSESGDPVSTTGSY
jgi:anti-sigma factor (TIGR02949 family)